MSAINRVRLVALVGAVVVSVQGVVALAATWIYVSEFDREFPVQDAPSASVVLVLGSRVDENGPGSYVRGRLDTALELYQTRRVERILNSGNGQPVAGNEPAVMRAYLEERGVPATAIIDDPEGYDTAASCLRTREVFGFDDVLIVTQDFHLGRAIALCRDAGVDARGVYADCACATWTVVRNHIRETYLAGPRALLTAVTN
ncbi:YdcF family protein [Williamsia sp.]|uniref:SanA/YdcF family protein n=1 Tax=Williamsia sp. TaxID=1872085 RepID=UPI002F928605